MSNEKKLVIGAVATIIPALANAATTIETSINNDDVNREYDYSLTDQGDSIKGNNGVDVNLNIYSVAIKHDLSKSTKLIAEFGLGKEESKNKLWESDNEEGKEILESGNLEYYEFQLGLVNKINSFMNYSTYLKASKINSLTDTYINVDNNDAKMQYKEENISLNGEIGLFNDLDFQDSRIGLDLGIGLGYSNVQNTFSEVDQGTFVFGTMKLKPITYNITASPYYSIKLYDNVSAKIAYKHTSVKDLSNKSDSFYDSEGGHIDSFNITSYEGHNQSVKASVSYNF